MNLKLASTAYFALSVSESDARSVSPVPYVGPHSHGEHGPFLHTQRHCDTCTSVFVRANS